MRARSLISGLLAPLAIGLATAAAEAPARNTWLYTALVEGCVASFKPGTTPKDMAKAGFPLGGDLASGIKQRLARGLGGMYWFELAASEGIVHVGRSAKRRVCMVVQTEGSSAEGVKHAQERLLAAKARPVSSTPGKTLTRNVYSMAAGDHDMWISLAHTNDFQPGKQGASAVIVVELKKR